MSGLISWGEIDAAGDVTIGANIDRSLSRSQTAVDNRIKALGPALAGFTPEVLEAAKAAVAEAAQSLGLAPEYKGSIPNGTDLNEMFGAGWRGVWGADNAVSGQILSLLNMPEIIQGTLVVTSTDNGFGTQSLAPFNRTYRWERAQTKIGQAQWTEWRRVDGVIRGSIPNGTDLNNMYGDSFRGDWWGDNAVVGQIVSLVNWPAITQGTLTVASTGNGFSTQTVLGVNGAIYYRVQTKLQQAQWSDWVLIDGLARGPVRHDLLIEEMRRYTTVPALDGAVPVALICDHGTNNFRDIVLPALTSRGLECTLALNSDMYNPEAPRYAYDNKTSWAEINEWPVEIANHGRTHGSMNTTADLHHEIVDGLEELREKLPSKRIFAWVQTGQSNNQTWQGFANGATAQAWGDSAAGPLIWDNHAVSTGALAADVPALYPIDGHPKQGVWGYWIDTPAGITTAKARIQEAISQGKGIVLRHHPELLNQSGKTTTAQLTEFLEWLKTQQDSGAIKTLTFSQWNLAGDRGLRTYEVDVTSVAKAAGALAEGNTGSLFLRRVGNLVTARFTNLLLNPDSTGLVSFGTVPVGYQPAWYLSRYLWLIGLSNGIGTPQIVSLASNQLRWQGDLQGNTSRPSLGIQGEVTWETGTPWPTT